MKRRIPMALLLVGAVGFYACSDGPVAVDDVGNPLFRGPSATLPSITAGGITLNIDAGANAFSIGGFNAQATSTATDPLFPARGQFQAKSVPDDLGILHANVVCIANLGPSTVVNGFGGIAGTDVWEIRIEITQVSSPFLLVGDHGSIFVQDNGTGSGVDFADENFGNPTVTDCGETPGFTLEPVLAGSITVRD